MITLFVFEPSHFSYWKLGSWFQLDWTGDIRFMVKKLVDLIDLHHFQRSSWYTPEEYPSPKLLESRTCLHDIYQVRQKSPRGGLSRSVWGFPPFQKVDHGNWGEIHIRYAVISIISILGICPHILSSPLRNQQHRTPRLISKPKSLKAEEGLTQTWFNMGRGLTGWEVIRA